MRATRSGLVGLALLVGCDGEELLSGAAEPVLVQDAVFHEGPLPVDDGATTPVVTNAGGLGSVVAQGQAGALYSGLTSTDGYSVAVALQGAGTGYWVAPLGAPDVTAEGQLQFQLTVDFGRDAPFGLQELSFVAIDGEGAPGPRYGVPVCVLPDVANHNLAACSPEVVPQAAVISLSWDAQVDLDLVVEAPNGKRVDAKAPTTLLPGEDGKITTGAINDPSTGTLTRDSNADCRIDGVRRESLVFVGEPPPGDYRVYARLHSACGRPAVTWNLDLFRRVDAEAEGEAATVAETHLGTGILLSTQASAPGAPGTWVTTVTFP